MVFADWCSFIDETQFDSHAVIPLLKKQLEITIIFSSDE